MMILEWKTLRMKEFIDLDMDDACEWEDDDDL